MPCTCSGNMRVFSAMPIPFGRAVHAESHGITLKEEFYV